MSSIALIAGLGGLILFGISSIPALIGFGTVGVVAGSAAAGVQAGMGSVAAGSWFATITSLAMKGAFLKTAAAGAATSLSGLLAFFL